MSDKIHEFCESLKAQLKTVEDHLAKVGESLKAAPQQAADAVHSSIDAAKAQHQQNVQKIADAKAKLDKRLEEKKEEVESQIEEWKTKRDISKLDKRAEKAEDYAVTAIEFAAACAAEADLATLEAIAARIDVEEARERAG